MLYLQELLNNGKKFQSFELTQRLPSFLIAPCVVKVTYEVEKQDDYYLVSLEVSGDLNIICQRCMGEFVLPYHNNTVIAVCKRDEQAEQMSERYECIVAPLGQISLEEIIVDELHLYVTQFHPDINDCDEIISHILSEKIETY